MPNAVLRRSIIVVCLAGAASFTTGAAAPEQITVHGTATVGGRPAADVVIWLDAPNAPHDRQTAKVVLDQRNLSFYPHVLAVRVGTTVDFPNDDRVFHNVFSFKDGKRFDLGMYPPGQARSQRVPRALFTAALLSRLEHWLDVHAEEGFAPVRTAWSSPIAAMRPIAIRRIGRSTWSQRTSHISRLRSRIARFVPPRMKSICTGPAWTPSSQRHSACDGSRPAIFRSTCSISSPP